jgi:hypothetical protein
MVVKKRLAYKIQNVIRITGGPTQAFRQLAGYAFEKSILRIVFAFGKFMISPSFRSLLENRRRRRFFSKSALFTSPMFTPQYPHSFPATD